MIQMTFITALTFGLGAGVLYVVMGIGTMIFCHRFTVNSHYYDESEMVNAIRKRDKASQTEPTLRSENRRSRSLPGRSRPRRPPADDASSSLALVCRPPLAPSKAHAAGRCGANRRYTSTDPDSSAVRFFSGLDKPLPTILDQTPSSWYPLAPSW